MSRKIVKYHNDFNKVRIPGCNEVEQNILMGIATEVRDKGSNVITFFYDDLAKYSQKNITKEQLTYYLQGLRVGFFKADFTIARNVMVDGKLVGEQTTFNLFKQFTIQFDTEKGREFDFKKLEVQINDSFAYLLNELTGNFTDFELQEFISLTGKYTKTLYRLLKQYKSTGFMQMNWDEFIEIMDIPKDYSQCDIDKRILKPAIKELTRERTLFDMDRIPFQNLKYEKIKGKGRGRGGVVLGIRFTFDIQHYTQKDRRPLKVQLNDALERNAEYMSEYAKTNLEKLDLKQENEALKQRNLDLQTENFKMQIELQDSRMLNRCDKLCDLHFIKYDKYEREQTNRINKITELKNGLNQIFYRAEIINCDNNQIWEKDFDSFQHIINYVKKNEVIYKGENTEIMRKRGYAW